MYTENNGHSVMFKVDNIIICCLHILLVGQCNILGQRTGLYQNAFHCHIQF